MEFRKRDFRRESVMIKKLTSMVLLLILICAVCLQCSSEKKEAQQHSGVMTGWVSKNELFSAFPAYKQSAADYQPDQDIISQIDALDKDAHALIILGTWCSDSRREVPRFLKIIDALQQTNLTYRMFAVDRASADTTGMREEYDVEYVPTFIIYENDQEIDRIIERPMMNLEIDLLEIMQTEP
ncbi:hypothetical protein GF337_04285 [candidate division KSB1 bacterium]|nr:hypothetical protein [candidate division KSB1 bacterium]